MISKNSHLKRNRGFPLAHKPGLWVDSAPCIECSMSVTNVGWLSRLACKCFQRKVNYSKSWKLAAGPLLCHRLTSHNLSCIEANAVIRIWEISITPGIYECHLYKRCLASLPLPPIFTETSKGGMPCYAMAAVLTWRAANPEGLPFAGIHFLFTV